MRSFRGCGIGGQIPEEIWRATLTTNSTKLTGSLWTGLTIKRDCGLDYKNSHVKEPAFAIRPFLPFYSPQPREPSDGYSAGDAGDRGGAVSAAFVSCAREGQARKGSGRVRHAQVWQGSCPRR